MRLRLGTLRRWLRETVTNQGLASVQKTGQEPMDRPQDGPDVTANKRPVERFFGGKKFMDDAVKLYRNLSVPIYVVPVWSYKDSNIVTGNERTTTSEDASALTQYGISSERAAELERARAGGAAIIVAMAAELSKGNLPTPWMIVHAMFDAGDASPFLPDVWQRVYDNDRFLDMWESRDGSKEKRFMSALTMASARNKQIFSYSDAIAEIMTQAVLTTNGFTYNETDDPELNEFLEHISSVLQDVRRDFEQAISGQVITVEVHLIN